MINHIHQALAQVRELRQAVLEKQYFRGYSGRARVMAGTVALGAAAMMGAPGFPLDSGSHVLGWGAVFLVGVLLNYGALFYWYFSEQGGRRDVRRLKPALDVLPPLVVGGVLTFALLREQAHHLLPGVWMMLFGVANLVSQRVLPKMIGAVGWYYVACGAACLAVAGEPGFGLVNPWPMGVVFFVGEWAGGLVLHHDRAADATLSELVLRMLMPEARREDV